MPCSGGGALKWKIQLTKKKEVNCGCGLRLRMPFWGLWLLLLNCILGRHSFSMFSKRSLKKLSLFFFFCETIAFLRSFRKVIPREAYEKMAITFIKCNPITHVHSESCTNLSKTNYQLWLIYIYICIVILFSLFKAGAREAWGTVHPGASMASKGSRF